MRPWHKVPSDYLMRADYLSLTGPARLTWLASWAYCADQRTDGFIPVQALRFIDGDESIAEQLVNQQLWRRLDSGWWLVEFGEDGVGNWTKEARERASEAGRRGGAPKKPYPKGHPFSRSSSSPSLSSPLGLRSEEEVEEDPLGFSKGSLKGSLSNPTVVGRLAEASTRRTGTDG